MNIKYLLEHQFKIVSYKTGQVVYQPDHQPKAVYFIKSGRVKMVTVNADGDEFIQNIFKTGEYFGEPALILNKPYLAYTITLQDTELIPVHKEAFFKMLTENPAFSLKLIENLSKRLFYKSMMLEELANEQADHRIITLLKHTLQDVEDGQPLKITRQQLADMSGLRVETVIRTIKKLANSNHGFKLVGGKIVKSKI